MAGLIFVQCGFCQSVAPPTREAPAQHDARMAWFREARFGMFIHWGLYAIPAGQWRDRSDYGEWIRHSAQIPVDEYDKFLSQFNPEKFNADEWVAIAKDAGVRYIVITSKHHDGFCLFDSQATDFDVMSTPFKRDILRELSAACSKAGIRMCWYHSIMDWHHPDYLPRRPWEKDSRPESGARLDNYVRYLRSQLRELLTNYGPIGILWFDGQWESTWTNELGAQIEKHVRGIQPQIIINSRVGHGGGPYGIDRGLGGMGDYATPEQFIPDTGVPGIDWETCMTMNEHWGYCAADHNWKSSRALIRNLVDIASKGGNFLLNVGPTAEGLFPQESIERLRAIGAWLRVNGEAIYGTQASPMPAPKWGRVTLRTLGGERSRLYLHVFDWPEDGALLVPGLLNSVRSLTVLGQTADTAFKTSNTDRGIAVDGLPAESPNADCTVLVLDFDGVPDIAVPPAIGAESDIFISDLAVNISSPQKNVQIHYTLDGGEPTRASPILNGPITIHDTTTITARAFRGETALAESRVATFRKVVPHPADTAEGLVPGLEFAYYEGTWDKLPDFAALTPKTTGIASKFSLKPAARKEDWALRFAGYVDVPTSGLYQFFLSSDDGSRLWIGDQLVVDNDGLHGSVEKSGRIALAAGKHAIQVALFQRSGDVHLSVSWQAAGSAKTEVSELIVSHKP